MRLTDQQAALWRALSAASPHYLCLRSLAVILGKLPDERGIKQAADAVHKLRRSLAVQAAPWRVRRLQRGHYGITASRRRSEAR